MRVGEDVARVPQLRRPGGRVGTVVGTRLQEGDRPPEVLRQPARQDAPGRSRTHDDDVEPPVVRHGIPFLRVRSTVSVSAPAFYPCPAADAAGVAFRPYAKTHKAPAIAARQLAAGAVGLVVAKVAEAEIFAAAGCHDIVIAYPVIGLTSGAGSRTCSHLHDYGQRRE